MNLKRTLLATAATIGTAALLNFAPARAEDAPKPVAPPAPAPAPAPAPEVKTEAKKDAPAPKADEPKKDDSAETPKKKPQTLEEAIASIPAESLDDGTVLLVSGAIQIKYDSVEPMEKAAWVAHKKRDPTWDFQPGEQAALRKQIGVKLLGNAVVEFYAADNKLVVPDDKYKQVFERFKLAKEQRGGYDRFLTESGINDGDFQRFLRSSVAIENQMAQSVSEDDVKKWVEAHKDEVPRRRVSEIMFTYKGVKGAPETVARTKEEAQKLSGELLKKLRENPNSDFAGLAKSMSDGPSAQNAGDIGYVPKKANTLDTISDAVYKIEKVGDYSEVVETPFGFHVFKLTQLRDDAEVNNSVKDQLTSERFGATMQKLMEDAVGKAKFNKKLL